jgi:hypothetical protein
MTALLQPSWDLPLLLMPLVGGVCQAVRCFCDPSTPDASDHPNLPGSRVWCGDCFSHLHCLLLVTNTVSLTVQVTLQ